MQCPALAPVDHGNYIQTSKEMARKMKRKGGIAEESILQTRWGKQYKSCPTGIIIPKSKVKCVLNCDPDYVLKTLDGKIKPVCNNIYSTCNLTRYT